jgi:ribonucleotide reductase beta subunit family protein with ferritin-like domain
MNLELTVMSFFNIDEEDGRMTTFPIHRPELFEYYRQAGKCHWDVDEVVLSKDAEDYRHRLNDGERRFVAYVLAFFAASDGIVNVNLVGRFRAEVPMLEARYFYDAQIAMENIHAHMYSLLLDSIIVDSNERKKLQNAAMTIPVVSSMTNYMRRCIESNEPLPLRLLRMACVEGIFFTGCFCAIYWMQSRGLMPGLGQSNELIARDEALHTYFAITLYNMTTSKPEISSIHAVFAEAVQIAREFTDDALPKGLPEMNAALMAKYIECCADNLLVLIECPVLFSSTHSFTFMNAINLQLRTNFFERRATTYSKVAKAETQPFELADDL